MFLMHLFRMLRCIREREKPLAPWEQLWFTVLLCLALLELEFAWICFPVYCAIEDALTRIRARLGFGPRPRDGNEEH